MRLGIRLVILLSLGVLLTVAFVPLYAAVSRLAQASFASARRDAAQDLGRAVAAHVLEARKNRAPSALGPVLEAQLSDGGVLAIAVYDRTGRVAAAGETGLLRERASVDRETVTEVKTERGPGLYIVIPNERGDGAVSVVLALGEPVASTAPFVRLIALYMGVIALALLVFAYFAMTRLVVRPIDDLSRAASRVAAGARKLELRGTRARELADLGDSLKEMTAKLIADEAALRSKVEELERTTRELQSAQETVIRSERLASVGRLAAGVAHEIGNPIAAILGFEELLLAGGLSEEEERDFLERMKRETERVHGVLRDLLDFARPRADVIAGEASCDPREALELVLALVRPQRQVQRVSLDTSVAKDAPRVALAVERLQQVLLNLVLNAADAAKSKVLVRVEARDGRAMIRVDDDGPGVAPSVRPKLFEPFVTTKQVGKGTGLGLAVCRGLVEAAGGTISLVEGELGGACFELELPAARSSSPES
ncbi:MAG: ATP-binding protein [Polyangiaceae bacterium]